MSTATATGKMFNKKKDNDVHNIYWGELKLCKTWHSYFEEKKNDRKLP